MGREWQLNSETGFLREPDCVESCVDECSSSNWIAESDTAGQWEREVSYTVTINCGKFHVKELHYGIFLKYKQTG